MLLVVVDLDKLRDCVQDVTVQLALLLLRQLILQLIIDWCSLLLIRRLL